MARVRAFSLAGRTVNVPHSEYRISDDVSDHEGNAVTFDSEGFAVVSDLMAESLLMFYPTQVEMAAEAPARKPRAKQAT